MILGHTNRNGRVVLLVVVLGRVAGFLLPGSRGFFRAGWPDGEGDPAGCGVFEELCGGPDAPGAGPGGDAVCCQDGDGPVARDADGGLVDAEEASQERPGHAEADMAGGGGQDGLVRQPGVAGIAAAGAAALAAAPEGELVLAGGVPFQDGLLVQAGGDAGKSGEGLQQGGVRPGGVRPGPGLRDIAGLGEDGVVPLAVEGTAVDDAVLEVPHPLVADLDAVGVVAVVEDGGDLQAPGGGGGLDAGQGVLHGQQRGGAPGAGDVAEQPVLDLVPLGGPGPMPLLVSCELSSGGLTAAGA